MPFSLSSGLTYISFLSLYFLFACPILVGCSVHPSSNFSDLSWAGRVRYRLQSPQIALPSNVTLAPLTDSLSHVDRQYAVRLSTIIFNNVHVLINQNFKATGDLIDVNAFNPFNVGSHDLLAFVSCDKSDYPGEIDASGTVANLVNSRRQPVAIILYSQVDSHCTYTPNSNPFGLVFSLLNRTSARDLKHTLNSQGSQRKASIVADMSLFDGAPPQGLGGGGDDSGDGHHTNTGSSRS